ncbi:MAG: hypothetical protein IJE78_06165 [Bacteroidaceae bacterium]|nr:hypothetical protein [Bacteroidaceae bacterium]
MERLTRYDPVNQCYKMVRDPEPGRSIIQELGVYETIHEQDIAKATNISDIRDRYKAGNKLSPYWENHGKSSEDTTSS